MSSVPPLDAATVATSLRHAPERLVPCVEETIERVRQEDPTWSAMRLVTADRALEQARRLAGMDPEPRDRLALYGVPLAVKECVPLAGEVTGLGGRSMTHPEPSDDPIVARLCQAGAVLIGSTRMSEFGQEPWTRGAWGMTRNPMNPAVSPGGSSGGSAVAVAAGWTPIALGVDSGGSVRLPAACTGLLGFKPSNDRWNDSSTPDMWCGLGTVGVLARSLDDIALVDSVVTSQPNGLGSPSAERPLRIGLSLGLSGPGLPAPDPAVAAGISGAVARWRAAGHSVRAVDLPPLSTRVYGALFLTGMAAMAREVDRPDLLEARTRHAAAAGRVVRQVRVGWRERAVAELRDRVDRLLGEVDIIVMPTLRTLPPRAAPAPTALRPTLAAARPLIAHTALFNVTGHPALAVPLPGSAGPVSAQLVGRRGADRDLLAAAQVLVGALDANALADPVGSAS